MKQRKNARTLGVQESKKKVKNIQTRRTKTSVVTRDIQRKGFTKKHQRKY